MGSWKTGVTYLFRERLEVSVTLGRPWNMAFVHQDRLTSLRKLEYTMLSRCKLWGFLQ